MRFVLPFLVVFFAVSAVAQQTSRTRSEVFQSARQEFTIDMGGTLDAANTRDPIVYEAWRQRFEPMRSVRMENTGDTDVINPWVLVNGKRDWRTVESIADSAMREYGDPAVMTDAEKARAIWDFQRSHRFHATTGDFEVRDPVKMFNVYGYSLCGDNAAVLGDVWRAAGFKTRRGFAIGHCVTEVWYDGAWHLFDADESVLFLDRDNHTVASEKAVARDHDLTRRGYASDVLPGLYSYDGRHAGDYPSHTLHAMKLTLRPGEAIEWRWDHKAKHHHGPLPSLYTLNSTELSRWGERAWAALANGVWTYAPSLRAPAGQRHVEAVNVRWAGGNRAPAAAAADPSKPALLAWKMQAPYAVVGGVISARLKVGKRGAVILKVSRDREHWTEVGRYTEGAGTAVEAEFDNALNSSGEAVYEFWAQVDLTGGAGLDSIAITADLQMARLSLPALERGLNRIRYQDETAGPRTVKITYEWVESAAPVPAAPASANLPADRSEVEGTRPSLAWAEVDGAAAYRIQLGDDAGLRWALTPAFDAVLDMRPGVPARFEVARDGLLNPGQRYYWRVAAKSADGVWGPWSKTWSFVPRGPGVPGNLRLRETGPNTYALEWDGSPAGRKAARYLVYASNEKGFPASDTEYEAPVGNQKDRGLFPGEKRRRFPGNLLATTTAPALPLTPRHAFYRVVAVDEQGVRSGSSDYLAAPRPFIYSDPPREGKVGAPYRYEVKTIASIGDLTFRDFGPGQSYQSAYWDADRPKFSLEFELPRCGNFDPKWLRIDPDTGVLSGTPGVGDANEYQVNVRVDIAGNSYVQSYPLIIRKD